MLLHRKESFGVWQWNTLLIRTQLCRADSLVNQFRSSFHVLSLSSLACPFSNYGPKNRTSFNSSWKLEDSKSFHSRSYHLLSENIRGSISTLCPGRHSKTGTSKSGKRTWNCLSKGILVGVVVIFAVGFTWFVVIFVVGFLFCLKLRVESWGAWSDSLAQIGW